MLPKLRPPTHPGQMLLKEFLEPMRLTQSELARRLKWPYARLNGIVNGKRGVTAGSALALGDCFNTGAEFWMNLQRDWDLWRAKRRHKTRPPIARAG
jgi:addiction module HigA family antidote